MTGNYAGGSRARRVVVHGHLLQMGKQKLLRRRRGGSRRFTVLPLAWDRGGGRLFPHLFRLFVMVPILFLGLSGLRGLGLRLIVPSLRRGCGLRSFLRSDRQRQSENGKRPKGRGI